MRNLLILSTFTLFLFLVVFQCRSPQKEIDTENYYSDIISTGGKHILYENIDLQKITIENLNSSYIGYLRVMGDSLYFVDVPLSRLFPMDFQGLTSGFRLGQGRGPQEYFGGVIEEIFKTKDHNYLILGPSWDLHLFNESWEFQNVIRLDWGLQHTQVEREQNPQPDMPGVYDLALDAGNIRAQIHENYIYLEMYSEHPGFNMINFRDYYRKGRLIARINYLTGKVDEYLGVRSPVYENYEFIGHLSRFYHWVDGYNQRTFLSFPPDSLIYLCDMDFMPIEAFGRAGKDMNTDYTQFSGDDYYHFREIFASDLGSKGYYTAIEFVPQKDLLFRSYTKGKHSDFDGLQIYKDRVLIADLDVPKGFKVMGYIDPYFFGNPVIDLDNKSITIFRFKL